METKEHRRKIKRDSKRKTRAMLTPEMKQAIRETEHHQKALARSVSLSARDRDIAVMDFETEPFDNSKPDDPIKPFLFVLYRSDADPVVIWDEDEDRLYAGVIDAIQSLPRKFTVYAHNGGKFDFKFFIHKIRGRIQLKDSAIMTARIGDHELRDSMHIIPTALAAYRKDAFDYTWMHKKRRHNYRNEIVEYCIADCKYTLEMVLGFIERFGRKLSIGQAAITQLREKFPDLGRLSDKTDASIREFFFGGRVDCLAGAGRFRGHYKMYDVNSMYPYVMAYFDHPATADIEYDNKITANTIFIRLRCKNLVGSDAMYGAFLQRVKVRDNVSWEYLEDETENSSSVDVGTFETTIWEYNVAVKYNLISNVHIIETIGFPKRTNFADFILPLYEERETHKQTLADCTAIDDVSSEKYFSAKKDSLFVKLIMNNAYGKFAQDPRKFQDRIITDDDVFPDGGDDWEIDMRSPGEYIVWSRPSRTPMRFNNVATGASITGAARAVLLEAICLAVDPIYCDTDSLICRELRGVRIDTTALGAWSLEAEYDEVIICGKKLYACRNTKKPQQKEKRVHKGAPRLTFENYEEMLRGQVINTIAFAPTLKFGGAQQYIHRRIRATAPMGLAAYA